MALLFDKLIKEPSPREVGIRGHPKKHFTENPDVISSVQATRVLENIGNEHYKDIFTYVKEEYIDNETKWFNEEFFYRIYS